MSHKSVCKEMIENGFDKVFWTAMSLLDIKKEVRVDSASLRRRKDNLDPTAHSSYKRVVDDMRSHRESVARQVATETGVNVDTALYKTDAAAKELYNVYYKVERVAKKWRRLGRAAS